MGPFEHNELGQPKKASLFARTYAEYNGPRRPEMGRIVEERQYQVQIRPPEASLQPRVSLLQAQPRVSVLQSRPRFRAIQNNPSAVIDHRNNPFQMEPQALNNLSREENRVEELKMNANWLEESKGNIRPNQRQSPSRVTRNERLYQSRELEDVNLNFSARASLVNQDVSTMNNAQRRNVFSLQFPSENQWLIEAPER